MKTDSLEVGRTLQDNKRFTVPIYQRQYAWGDERLVPFWEDVAGKAEEALESRPKFQHYMGALILAPGVDGYTVGRIPTVQVVDGQQRLTTFQLFLAALRRVARDGGHAALADSLDLYLHNDSRGAGAETDSDRAKLLPTPADRQLYRDLMELSPDELRQKYPNCFFQNGNPIKRHSPRALWAYFMFLDRIDQFARLGKRDRDSEAEAVELTNEERRVRLQVLADALLLYLKLVIINLEEGDDAQVIFETLNSRGEPLLAMDLVRNNIFHRAEAQGESAEQLFAAKWSRLDEQFWKDIPARAKPQKPRIDFFLSHVLTAETGEEASLRELYAEYRAFVRPKGKLRFATVEQELDCLLRFTDCYRALEEAQVATPVGWLGRKLATWEVTTAYPVVFRVATAEEADDVEKERIYRLIYSYIVRRAVCGLTAKNLNKTFQRVVKRLIEDGVSVAVFADAFAGQAGPAVRFPDDQEFRSAILSNPAYQQFPGKAARLVDILWELELASRTKFMVNTERPDHLSIEHVLPRAWPEHWPLQDARKAPPDKFTGADEAMLAAISRRDSLLHSLGNLTLVTEPLNPSLSHRAFGDKKPQITRSLLALNNYFAGLDCWDEEAILARGRVLAELTVPIWPACPSPQAHSAVAVQ